MASEYSCSQTEDECPSDAELAEIFQVDDAEIEAMESQAALEVWELLEGVIRIQGQAENGKPQ